MDDALQAVVLLLESEELPDLCAATLDEIFAVGVWPDDKLDDFLGPVVVTMALSLVRSVARAYGVLTTDAHNVAAAHFHQGSVST